MNFTEEQTEIIKENAHSIKVLAGAGTGKTTTMASFVYNAIKSGIYRDSEIMFITFTRFAGEEIRKKITKASPHINILTGTIHSAMFRLLKQASITRPITSKLYDVIMDESVKFFLKMLEEKNDRLVSVLANYKLLVVDEFQDLDDEQFLFIKLFRVVNPTLRLVAIGDLAQNIYRFRGTSNEFLRTRLQSEIEPQLKTYKLTTNFRSSKRILNAVNAIFDQEIADGLILPMNYLPETKTGLMPKYYEYAINPGKGLGEYEKLVAETIMPIILRAKTESKSAVLIFPVIKCASFQIVTSLLRDYSRKSGYILDMHQIAKEDTTSTTLAFRYDPKSNDAPVQFSSFHAAKGLEWDIVFIINASDSMYEIRDYEDNIEGHIAEKTNLFYVGLTRAIQELYIFANANMGGRHRLLARLQTKIDDVLEVTKWGKDEHSPKGEHILQPIAVTSLVRHLPQYQELFQRAKEASQNIKSYQHQGSKMQFDYVYEEMKLRNRELAFGTYIDWKVKQLLCTGHARCIQDTLLDTVEFFSGIGKMLHKKDAADPYPLRKLKLSVDFDDSGINPDTPIEQFVHVSRIIAMYNGKYHSCIQELKDLQKRIEYRIRMAASKKNPTIREQYIVSQSRQFFTSCQMSEIQSVYAPTDKYMGLPKGFNDFVEKNNVTTSIKNALSSLETNCKDIRGDIAVEYSNARIITGEIDLYLDRLGGIIIEMKCSNIINPIEIRDTGNCTNLLQLLSYVALGRHGSTPIKARWAFLINPLTSAYERYDLDKWSHEDSQKFLDALNDLAKLV
jgi:hypothetical protein